MPRTLLTGPATWAVLFALCTSLHAQLGPGNPLVGLELRVRVTLEHDALMKRSARVQLLTISGVVVREAFTNQEGWALFPRMGAGEFRLDVSGDGIERFVTGAFTIYPQERQHLEFIQVHSKNGDRTEAPGSVTAANLNVPAAAKKEYEDGTRAFTRGEWSKASGHFGRATVLYPDYSLAYNAMGVVYLKTSDRELARQSFEKAISIDKQFAPAYVNLAKIAFQDKKYDETESLVLKSFSTEQATPEELTLLAAAELLSGKYDEAVANARKVHAIPHKGYASAHYLAARALEAKNLSSEAAEEYEILLQEAPDDPNAVHAREALVRLQK